MNLKGIRLSKTSQAETDTYCLLTLVCGILKNESNIEIVEMVARAWQVKEIRIGL